MTSRLVVVWIVLALARMAHATALRVSAEPPLSAERLADVLRSYLEGVAITLASPSVEGDPAAGAPRLGQGEVSITLRASRTGGQDAEIVLADSEETTLARLSGVVRTEDLYRAAALKIEALLQRRMMSGLRPLDLSEWGSSASHAARDRVWLDAGFACMIPSDGPHREGLRLGAGLGLAQRWRMGFGAYLETPQSVTRQDINLRAWELPFWISLGFAWHQGGWQGSAAAVGHAALRRLSAQSPRIVSNSDTSFSPRVGGALALAYPVGTSLRAEVRLALLAALADRRYLVDSQVVWPATRTLLMIEAGILYGVH